MQLALLNLDQASDLALARELVEAVAGKSLGEPELVTHGYSNQVLMFQHDNLVARFPRNELACRHVIKEADHLQMLASYTFPLRIPKLIHRSLDPIWTLTSYISGRAYPSTEIHNWDPHIRSQLGTKLAQFLYTFHSTVTLPAALAGEQPLIEQFRADIASCPVETLRSTAAQELSRLEDMLPSSSPRLCIYGDIHGANLLFTEDKQLEGIIDFADMHAGSVYEELRRIYILDRGETFVAARHEYERLSSTTLDENQVRQWAMVHELSVLCRHYNEPDYPSLPRAREHVASWTR